MRSAALLTPCRSCRSPSPTGTTGTATTATSRTGVALLSGINGARPVRALGSVMPCGARCRAAASGVTRDARQWARSPPSTTRGRPPSVTSRPPPDGSLGFSQRATGTKHAPTPFGMKSPVRVRTSLTVRPWAPQAMSVSWYPAGGRVTGGSVLTRTGWPPDHRQIVERHGQAVPPRVGTSVPANTGGAATPVADPATAAEPVPAACDVDAAHPAVTIAATARISAGRPRGIRRAAGFGSDISPPSAASGPVGGALNP